MEDLDDLLASCVSEELAVRVEAYHTLLEKLTSLTPGTEWGLKTTENLAMKIMSFIKSDMFSSEDNVSYEVTGFLGCYLANEKLMDLLTVEKEQEIFDCLIKLLEETKEKTVLSRGLWSLAQSKFECEIYSNNIVRLLNLINEILMCDPTSIIIYECLQVMKSLIESIPKEIINKAEIWLPKIFAYLFHDSLKVRGVAYSCFNFCHMYSQQHNINNFNKHFIQFIPALKTQHCKQMTKLIEENCTFVLKIWRLLVIVLGKDLHTGTSLINGLLEVVEKAFKNSKSEFRVDAFKCWHILIGNFAVDGEVLSHPKRLRLLVAPLKANNAKTEDVAYIKLHTWWFLICSLGEKLKSSFDLIVTPMLKFCFNSNRLNQTALNERTLLMSGTLTHCTKYTSLLLKSVEVLVFILNKDYAAESGFEFTISEPNHSILNSNLLIKNYQLIFGCVADALISLDSTKQSHLQIGTIVIETILKHVNDILKEHINKKESIDAVKELLSILDFLESQSKPGDSLSIFIYKTLENISNGRLAFPRSVLHSRLYYFPIVSKVRDMMHGNLSNFLIHKLARPVLLNLATKETGFLQTWMAVLQKSKPSTKLLFFEAVIVELETAVPLLSPKQSDFLVKLWVTSAQELYSYIDETQQINQGDNSEHDYTSIYNTLIYPLNFSENISSIKNKTYEDLISCWNTLWYRFTSLTPLTPTAEPNSEAEFIAKKLLSIIHEKVTVPPDSAGFTMTFYAEVTAVIVEKFRFKEIGKKPKKLMQSPLKPRRKLHPLHNLASVLEVLVLLMERALQMISMNRHKVIQKLSLSFYKIFSSISQDQLVWVIISNVLEVMKKTLQINPTAKFNSDVERNIISMWNAFCGLIECRIVPSLTQEKLSFLAPVIAVALQSSHLGLKQRARLMWSTSLASTSLTIPDDLYSILKTVGLPPASISENLSESQSLSPKENIPAHISGSFLNREKVNHLSFSSPKESPKNKSGGRGKSPSVLSPKTPTRWKSPSSKTGNYKLGIDELKGEEFVKVESPKVSKRVLTPHQAEKMKERASDIPAMYNDMSQSLSQFLTQDSFDNSLQSKSSISNYDEFSFKGKINKKKELDLSPESNCSSASLNKKNLSNSDPKNRSYSDEELNNVLRDASIEMEKSFSDSVVLLDPSEVRSYEKKESVRKSKRAKSVLAYTNNGIFVLGKGDGNSPVNGRSYVNEEEDILPINNRSINNKINNSSGKTRPVNEFTSCKFIKNKNASKHNTPRKESDSPLKSIGKESDSPLKSIGKQSDSPLKSMGKQSDSPLKSMGKQSNSSLKSMGKQSNSSLKSIGKECDSPLKSIRKEIDSPSKSSLEETGSPLKSIRKEGDSPVKFIKNENINSILKSFNNNSNLKSEHFVHSESPVKSTYTNEAFPSKAKLACSRNAFFKSNIEELNNLPLKNRSVSKENNISPLRNKVLSCESYNNSLISESHCIGTHILKRKSMTPSKKTIMDVRRSLKGITKNSKPKIENSSTQPSKFSEDCDSEDVLSNTSGDPELEFQKERGGCDQTELNSKSNSPLASPLKSPNKDKTLIVNSPKKIEDMNSDDEIPSSQEDESSGLSSFLLYPFASSKISRTSKVQEEMHNNSTVRGRPKRNKRKRIFDDNSIYVTPPKQSKIISNQFKKSKTNDDSVIILDDSSNESNYASNSHTRHKMESVSSRVSAPTPQKLEPSHPLTSPVVTPSKVTRSGRRIIAPKRDMPEPMTPPGTGSKKLPSTEQEELSESDSEGELHETTKSSAMLAKIEEISSKILHSVIAVSENETHSNNISAINDKDETFTITSGNKLEEQKPENNPVRLKKKRGRKLIPQYIRRSTRMSSKKQQDYNENDSESMEIDKSKDKELNTETEKISNSDFEKRVTESQANSNSEIEKRVIESPAKSDSEIEKSVTESPTKYNSEVEKRTTESMSNSNSEIEKRVTEPPAKSNSEIEKRVTESPAKSNSEIEKSDIESPVRSNSDIEKRITESPIKSNSETEGKVTESLTKPNSEIETRIIESPTSENVCGNLNEITKSMVSEEKPSGEIIPDKNVTIVMNDNSKKSVRIIYKDYSNQSIKLNKKIENTLFQFSSPGNIESTTKNNFPSADNKISGMIKFIPSSATKTSDGKCEPNRIFCLSNEVHVPNSGIVFSKLPSQNLDKDNVMKVELRKTKSLDKISQFKLNSPTKAKLPELNLKSKESRDTNPSKAEENNNKLSEPSNTNSPNSDGYITTLLCKDLNILGSKEIKMPKINDENKVTKVSPLAKIKSAGYDINEKPMLKISKAGEVSNSNYIHLKSPVRISSPANSPESPRLINSKTTALETAVQSSGLVISPNSKGKRIIIISSPNKITPVSKVLFTQNSLTLSRNNTTSTQKKIDVIEERFIEKSADSNQTLCPSNLSEAVADNSVSSDLKSDEINKVEVSDSQTLIKIQETNKEKTETMKEIEKDINKPSNQEVKQDKQTVQEKETELLEITKETESDANHLHHNESEQIVLNNQSDLSETKSNKENCSDLEEMGNDGTIKEGEKAKLLKFNKPKNIHKIKSKLCRKKLSKKCSPKSQVEANATETDKKVSDNDYLSEKELKTFNEKDSPDKENSKLTNSVSTPERKNYSMMKVQVPGSRAAIMLACAKRTMRSRDENLDTITDEDKSARSNNRLSEVNAHQLSPRITPSRKRPYSDVYPEAKPWAKHEPSPGASPCGSILKKRLIEDESTNANSEFLEPVEGSPITSKNRRVSFADPPVSESVEIPPSPKILKGHKAQKRLDMTQALNSAQPLPCAIDPENLEDEEDIPLAFLTCSEPLYPTLHNCKHSSSSLAKMMTSPALVDSLIIVFKDQGIMTVGDFSKLSSVDLKSLPIRSPKYSVAIKSLKKYEESIIESETDNESETEQPLPEVDVDHLTSESCNQNGSLNSYGKGVESNSSSSENKSISSSTDVVEAITSPSKDDESILSSNKDKSVSSLKDESLDDSTMEISSKNIKLDSSDLKNVIDYGTDILIADTEHTSNMSFSDTKGSEEVEPSTSGTDEIKESEFPKSFCEQIEKDSNSIPSFIEGLTIQTRQKLFESLTNSIPYKNVIDMFHQYLTKQNIS